MARSTLLEMCIITLLSLPEERLGEVLPVLTSLAEPYADMVRENDELNRRIHDFLRTHRAAIERPVQPPDG